MTTPKQRITIERTFTSSIEEVWDLWTTKEGIESWWGPEGFTVTVSKIDLRAGGDLVYAMAATGPDQIAFMKRAGMPVSTPHKLTYREVVRHQRIAYTMMADFIPGVEPYEVATTVELRGDGASVKMLLTFDAMHDDVWTERSRMGRESELGRLAKILAK